MIMQCIDSRQNLATKSKHIYIRDKVYIEIIYCNLKHRWDIKCFMVNTINLLNYGHYVFSIDWNCSTLLIEDP